MYRKAKQRAKHKGLEFTITRKDIHIPLACPVLGMPLARSQIQAQAGSPSLDRIDNTRGYIPGNVRVISYRANSLKSNASPAELEAVLADLRRATPC